MKQAIQALISNAFAAKRAAVPATALRTVSREELRAVVGGATTAAAATTSVVIVGSPKGTW